MVMVPVFENVLGRQEKVNRLGFPFHVVCVLMVPLFDDVLKKVNRFGFKKQAQTRLFLCRKSWKDRVKMTRQCVLSSKTVMKSPR